MTKTYSPALGNHRTFDAGVNADGSEWMACDCHGYLLERTVTDGKRGAWMRVKISE